MNSDTTLAKILEGWLDGGLTDAEQADLLRQLKDDAELRRLFAEQVFMLGASRAAADANPRWLALFDLMERTDDSDGCASSFEAGTMKLINYDSRRSRHERRAVFALAAAVTLLLAGGFAWKINNSAPVTAAAIPKVDNPPVAVIIGHSPESGFETGTYLKQETISQKNGWMSLQTLNGVSVTLEAPFEATLLAHDRIRLISGTARVRVPNGAEGFRLESPAFDVVDLGTEFAAKVQGDGNGTCRVFEGKADVVLLDSMGQSKLTRRLTASNSVRITPSQQALQPIEENDSDYPVIKQAPRQTLSVSGSYAAGVVKMAPVGYWRFEAITDGDVVNEVPGGIAMHAQGGATIAAEDGGNHSGRLTNPNLAELFKIQGANSVKAMFAGDFTISFFTQFSWLQNFAMISAMRYDSKIQGHPMILQCYASLRKVGIDSSALHAVFRDPPAWDGGVEVVGGARLQPLRWHHISMTRRNGTATIYLDGKIVAGETVGAMPLDCHEIFIGRLNGNIRQSALEARGMVGYIDELAIFTRALNDAEIRQLGISGMIDE